MAFLKRKNMRGFTLLELIVTIAIMGVMMAFAVPSYQSWLEKNALQSALQGWRESFYYAQTVAMQKQTSITLCASIDGATCSSDQDYSVGWIVTTDAKNGKLLQDFVPSTMVTAMTMTHSKTPLTFLADGRLNGFVGSTLTALGKSGTSKELKINTEGRISG